jgi:hypothetical protein
MVLKRAIAFAPKQAVPVCKVAVVIVNFISLLLVDSNCF